MGRLVKNLVLLYAAVIAIIFSVYVGFYLNNKNIKGYYCVIKERPYKDSLNDAVCETVKLIERMAK